MVAGVTGVPTAHAAKRAREESTLAPEHAPTLHQLTEGKSAKGPMRRKNPAMTIFLAQVQL